MKYEFDHSILDAINNAVRTMKASPLILGGIAGSGGGIGGPPGGFVGFLPQTRVSYDYSEIASSGIPSSGMSLLDNLNHIRYRLSIVESGGLPGTIIVQDSGLVVASGITILNFVGDSVVVTETPSGVANITISGATGSGGSGNITIAEVDGVPTISGVTTIIFSGAAVQDDGSGQVTIIIPSGSGGNAIVLQDEGLVVSSGVSVINFIGDSVTAIETSSGIVSVTVSGVSGSGGSSNFLDLTDTPNTYAGSVGKAVVVNPTESELIFQAIPSGGHIIQSGGVPLTARSNLNFTGSGILVYDDPTNNATIVNITVSGISVGTTDMIASQLNGSQATAGQTIYTWPEVVGSSVSETRGQTIVVAGTLHDMHLTITSTQPATGNLVATLRKNGIDTALSITIPANAAAGVYKNTTNSVSVAVDDKITWKIVNSSASDSSAILETIGVLFDIYGGAGIGSAHIIQDEGSSLGARSNLNFVGSGVTVTDDPYSNTTVVTISGGTTEANIPPSIHVLTNRFIY